MSNCKNYKTDNGDTWVVGGKLVLEEGVEIVGLATENQIDSEATTIAALKEDFNSLLLKLKVAGLMTND